MKRNQKIKGSDYLRKNGSFVFVYYISLNSLQDKVISLIFILFGVSAISMSTIFPIVYGHYPIMTMLIGCSVGLLGLMLGYAVWPIYRYNIRISDTVIEYPIKGATGMYLLINGLMKIRIKDIKEIVYLKSSDELIFKVTSDKVMVGFNDTTCISGMSDEHKKLLLNILKEKGIRVTLK